MSLELKFRCACKLETLQSGLGVIFGFLDGGHALDSQSPHCKSHRENKRQIQTAEEGGHCHFPKETPSLKSCWANNLSDIAGVWLWRSRKLLLLWSSDIFHFWPTRRAEELYICIQEISRIASFFGTLAANLVVGRGNQPKCKKSPLPFLSSQISLHSISWTML